MQYLHFQLPSTYWQQTRQLRLDVFVSEQGVPEALEIDEFDATCRHFVAIKKKSIVGTLRLIINKKTAKLGRLAVAKHARHQGIATQLMQQALLFCDEQGIKEIELGSQVTVKDFYQKLGFQTYGEIFMDAGIPHIHMSKSLC